MSQSGTHFGAQGLIRNTKYTARCVIIVASMLIKDSGVLLGGFLYDFLKKGHRTLRDLKMNAKSASGESKEILATYVQNATQISSRTEVVPGMIVEDAGSRNWLNRKHPHLTRLVLTSHRPQQIRSQQSF